MFLAHLPPMVTLVRLARSLLLIAKLGDPKHRALVERCLTHANEFVRRNAEYGWRHTYGPK